MKRSWCYSEPGGEEAWEACRDAECHTSSSSDPLHGTLLWALKAPPADGASSQLSANSKGSWFKKQELPSCIGSLTTTHWMAELTTSCPVFCEHTWVQKWTTHLRNGFYFPVIVVIVGFIFAALFGPKPRPRASQVLHRCFWTWPLAEQNKGEAKGTFLFCILRIENEIESRSVVSNSLWPRGLYSPWDSPGQNTGVGGLSLLQGIFPTQRLNPGLLHCSGFFTSWVTRKALVASLLCGNRGDQ